MNIAVHNGNFHADDVFATAMLSILDPNIKIIRTRKEEDLKKADLRVDVGRKNNPNTGDFDHHQEGGAGKRKNGIDYASAGLVWKHFGDKITKDPEITKYLDEKIIQYVDANDVGINSYKSDIKIYTIAEVISSLNPSNQNNTEKDFDEQFNYAVKIIIDVLKREIKKAKEIIKARDILLSKISNSDKDYIILEEKIPWKETLTKESSIKYVVEYNKLENNWGVTAVPKEFGKFENRKDLPKSWRGLAGEDLAKITGVKDAIFCHNKLFCAIAKSKEGAIKLVEIALKNKTT